MRASRCELDRELDRALSGLTAERNLSLKSPRCHHCRHAGWEAPAHTSCKGLGTHHSRDRS